MGRPPGSKNRTLDQIALDLEIQAQKLKLKQLEAEKKAMAAKINAQQG